MITDPDKIVTNVKCRKASDFAEEIQTRFNRFVIKSDTQGLDAQILAQFPPSIWLQTERAVIEIWAIEEIEDQDVAKCLELWNVFDFISWSASDFKRLTIEEIGNFWLGKSGECRSLFLSRNK